MALLVEKHARYFNLCLNSLPQSAQTEDSNKLAIIYFNLYGLALIGKLKTSDHTGVIENIYSHLIPLKDDSIQAFRSSKTFELDSGSNEYDFPNLSSTFFALAILSLFEEDFSRVIDRHKVMRFVSRCQIIDGRDRGSFRPVLDSTGAPFGESDLRLCYIAASIRTILGYDKLATCQKEKNDIDVVALISYIKGCINVTGGMASESSEPHSGLTFCGISALSLLDPSILKGNESWKDSMLEWLAHRQVDYPVKLYDLTYEYHEPGDIGGFNGRPNKYADTCYSWWVLALVCLLCESNIVPFDLQKAVDYLLNYTQHKLMGGFGKSSTAFPDPMHSFLGLAALALIRQCSDMDFNGLESLVRIDPQLVITEALRQFLDSIWKDHED